MVPTVLHHVWVGPRPVPDAWAAAWADMHPSWEQHVWRQGDIEALPELDLRAWSHYLDAGCWHGAANVARLAILLEHGGVYVDIDSRPLRTFEGALWMGAGLFAAYEPNVPDLPGRVANGCIGAEPGHPALRTYRDLVAGLTVYEPSWDTTGGTALTAALLMHRRCCDVRILPARVFYPLDARGRITPGLEDAYSDHFWSTTTEGLAAPAEVAA